MMDINQAARMIEWLDEERRRDKALIATLEERLAQQQESLTMLTKRLNGVESDQTVIRAQMPSNTRDSELSETVRRDVLQLIEGVESKRLIAERETQRRMDLGQENVMRPVRELNDRLDRIERQTSELPGYQIERERVADNVGTLQQKFDDLSKKLEEWDRRLAFLEEQRRQDNRRLSEIQSDIPEVQKQIDSIRPKLTLLEDLALRTERRVQDVQNAERERRDEMQKFVDHQTLLVQQREQQVNELTKRFGDQEGIMQKNIERFETWSEAYRSMKKIIDDFDRIGERLERRINEVAEMQRLSEERFRQEWNGWTSDDQKRWKQFTVSNDEVWRGHDKEFDRFVQRMSELEGLFPPIIDNVTRLWSLERQRAHFYQDQYQELVRQFDTGTKLPLVKPVLNGNGSSNP